MLSKAIDLLSDRRNPAFLLAHGLQNRALRQRLAGVAVPPETEVRFALTFDVENDRGLSGEHPASAVGPFLSAAARLLQRQRVKATFFVQGSLAGEQAKTLHALEKKGHEIGLHGWMHEPWGNAWFLKERTPPPEERARRLRQALDAFRESGLARPQSFRAPYMVLSHESLRMLAHAGFTADSSWPSYRDPGVMITRRHPTQVPVSSDPVARLRAKGASYTVLNMRNLLAEGPERMLAHCRNIVRFQLAAGERPFLVFLAHCWEFERGGAERIYSKANYGKLERFVRKLEGTYRLHPQTMQMLAHAGRVY